MPNYNRMNKIYEEEGGSKKSREEEDSYADHEASLFIKQQEDDAILKDAKGWYCLVVTFKKEIILERYCRAKFLKIRKNKCEDYYHIKGEAIYGYGMLKLNKFVKTIKEMN